MMDRKEVISREHGYCICLLTTLREVKMKKLYLVSVMILLAFTVSAMAQTNLLPNGDLETLEPNFWTPIGEGPGKDTMGASIHSRSRKQ